MFDILFVIFFSEKIVYQKETILRWLRITDEKTRLQPKAMEFCLRFAMISAER